MIRNRRWAISARAYEEAVDPHVLPFDCSHEALCGRIFDRHRDRIRTRKATLAVSNLGRIIRSMLKLSNSRGFHETTLRDLADDVGLSMGGVYSYIDSKDTLILMILGEVMSSAIKVLDSAPDCVKADAGAHLRWLVHAHVELTERMLPWFVFSYMETKSFPDVAKKAAVENEIAVERIFADTLRRGVRSGRFSIPDVEMTAALIKPLLQDWYIKRSKYRKRSIGPRAYAEYVANFLEAALCSPNEQ